VDTRRYHPPVEIIRPADARTFLDVAGPLLVSDPIAEARHNLILGIASTLIDRPEVYPAFFLWVALDHEPVAAALMTPPYNLVLAEPASEEGLRALLLAVAADGAPVPGLVGNAPYVHAAAAAWSTLTGTRTRLAQSQGVHALSDVREVPRAPGSARAARPADRDLLLPWLAAFAAEAMPGPDPDPEHAERMLDMRLTMEDAGLWFWEEGDHPVSLAGFGGRTANGIRVGPVYTPPESRRRGYATSLVAELSRRLLRRYRTCFLYTDLANPTSNRIYADIGYERVCDSADYRFETTR
jgi:hypothetical protein